MRAGWMIKKTALITGATGGIGSAIAKALHSNGYNLSLLSRTIELKDTKDILAQRCDITDIDSVCKAVVHTISKFGRIDVLTNCAGISGYGTIEELDPHDVEEIYKVNVMGTLNVCKTVLPYMEEQRSGYIINIGSLRGIQYSAGKAAYSMSKAAVIALSKTLKEEVTEYGIKVTVINPGFVDTTIYGSTALRPYILSIPGQGLRIAAITQPQDIAYTVLYLLNLSLGAEIEELNIGRLWGIE